MIAVNYLPLIVSLIIVSNVGANILIKKGAVSGEHIFLNIYTLSGYAVFCIVLLLSIKLISITELKFFSVVMAMNYLFTFMAGVIFFKEGTNLFGIIGIVCISVGVVIFNI